MRRVRFALLAAVIGLSACGSGIKIQTDYDPTADFSALETYRWAQRQRTDDLDPRVYNDLVTGRVQRAFNQVLQEKGFREVSAGNPDFWIAWHGDIDGKMSLTTVNSGYGYGWGWYGYGGMGMSSSQTYVNEWNEGTLLIDIVEAAKDQLIWRGSATMELREGGTPEQSDANAYSVAQKLLKSFPPGEGS